MVLCISVKKMTEYAFNHGQKIKSIGPEMPEDPVCFPKASNMLRVEQGSLRCATCKFLTEETRRRAPGLVYSGSGFSWPTSGFH